MKLTIEQSQRIYVECQKLFRSSLENTDDRLCSYALGRIANGVEASVALETIEVLITSEALQRVNACRNLVERIVREVVSDKP